MPNDFSVLIVEDDDDARSNMVDILSLDGYQIEATGHCLPAINAVESRHFDAVIVDWRLPDGSGGDLIPMIKRELPDSPVVVVTGIREFDTAVTALRKGAYDFLTKPINPDALRSLLSRLVERKNHLREIDSSQMKMMENERLAAIGQMVAGLAHESRNAFQRSHACLAELTLDLQDMPDSLALVHKVQRALDDLNRLLEEVRGYSAPIILKRRECDLEALVNGSWQQIVDAKKKPAESRFELKVADDVPKSFFVDHSRLTQVIRNLFENALYAGGPGAHVVAEIAAVRLESGEIAAVTISISDNGSGVPKEQREEIFVPFVTTKTKGTGLGLAICRRIVEAHDGQIHVGEGQDDGAKFVISLPRVSKRTKSK